MSSTKKYHLCFLSERINFVMLKCIDGKTELEMLKVRSGIKKVDKHCYRIWLTPPVIV